MEYVLIFFGALILDYVWGKTVLAMAHSSAFSAASWGCICTMLTGLLTISYVSNPWLLIPAGIGAFIGVYISKVKKWKTH